MGFITMLDQWVREGDGFILVYDINTQSTFVELEEFYIKVQQNLGDAETNIPLVICGNKADLATPGRKDQVSKEEGESRATAWNATFLETSAKSCTNVDEAFMQCARLIREKRQQAE